MEFWGFEWGFYLVEFGGSLSSGLRVWHKFSFVSIDFIYKEKSVARTSIL
jgi:hypothetical protein